MNLIFDFDGTMIDSFTCVAKQMQSLTKEFELREINMDEINKLRDLSSKEVMEYFGIPIYKIPQLIYRIRKLLRTEIQNIPPIEGLPEVLRKTQQAGFTLRILTSNSKENVQTWLKLHDLDKLFAQIHTESTFFSKSHRLKKILRAYEIDRTTTFYIADETRDIDAANENAVHAVAVTWGYNSETVLLKHKPQSIAHTPADILKILRIT